MSTADIYLNVMTQADARSRDCCRDLERPCNASSCMAWRWQPLMADAQFQAAVVKAQSDLADKDGKKASHVKAAEHVKDNRAEYGLPTQPYLGFCGLAGGWKQ